MARTFDIVLEKDEDGTWVVTVPELPGCITQGRTKAAARANAREAIALHLEAFGAPEEVTVQEVAVDRVRVAS